MPAIAKLERQFLLAQLPERRLLNRADLLCDFGDYALDCFSARDSTLRHILAPSAATAVSSQSFFEQRSNV
jgi:hypothetical protein